jgi:hypothetical protein
MVVVNLRCGCFAVWPSRDTFDGVAVASCMHRSEFCVGCADSYLDHVIMLVVARLQVLRQPLVVHLVREEHHVLVPEKGGRRVSKVDIQFT